MERVVVRRGWRRVVEREREEGVRGRGGVSPKQNSCIRPCSDKWKTISCPHPCPRALGTNIMDLEMVCVGC